MSDYAVDYSDAAIVAQEDAIRADVAASQPLLGELEDVGVLLEQYKDNAAFLPKIHTLRLTYGLLRRSRGDGNCFYRSFAVSLFLRLKAGGIGAAGAATPSAAGAPAASIQALYESILVYVVASKDRLLALGYPEFTLPDFWEEFLNHMQLLPTYTDRDILALFNDAMASNYVICYLRCLTSLEMLSNPEAYAPFVDAFHPGMTLKRFCETENEPMAKEADHLQIQALVTGFGVPASVAYLDGSTSAEVTFHLFPDGAPTPLVHLLYRPGHYDILLPLPKAG